jgi:signal transduction histidine kinase
MKLIRNFSVRTKVLLAILAGIVVFSVCEYIISNVVLLQSYLDIEREEVGKDIGRAQDAIQEFSRQQTVKLKDWSQWKDSYDYGLKQHESFVESNLSGPTLANLDLSLMGYFDTEGKPISVFITNPETGFTVKTDAFTEFLLLESSLIRHENVESQTEGILIFPDGPYVVSSLPLLQTDGSGPASGALVFARKLDEEKIREIGELTNLSVSLFPFDAAALPEDVTIGKNILKSGERYAIVPAEQDVVRGYTVLYDITGAPALLLRIESARPIYAQGSVSFVLFMGIGAIALLLFGFVIIFLIERIIVARFLRLTEAVEKINSVHDLSIRMERGPRDEIGRLAEKINQMLRWLEESKEAEEKSRRSIERLLEEIRRGKERAEDMVAQRTHELYDEKARLLASINSLSFGFVVTDIEGTIVLKNPTLSRIIAFPRPPVFLKDIASVFDEETEADPPIDILGMVQASMDDKVSLERRDILYGNKFLRFFSAPIFAEEEAKKRTDTPVIGAVLLIEDETEMKVGERSREEFFSIASHELRTPLTAIRGNTELLLEAHGKAKYDKRTREMLENIDASSRHLIAIVNDFLEVSRLEQGKIDIKKEPVNLREIVDTVERNLKGLVRERKLSLTVEGKKDAPYLVLGDKERIEQVLDNLLGNAIKFTEKGGARLSFEETKRVVRLRVSDTGIGIGKNNQVHLFRKFHQAGEQLLARSAGQSTGLGLYICRLIMEALGGSVYLEASELGKGSVFVAEFPRAR